MKHNLSDLIHKWLLNHNGSVLVQLFRYTLVGGTAFVVDFALLYVLTSLVGINYLISASVSFMVGLCVNYLISVLWVFQKDEAYINNKWVEFLACAFIGVVGLGLNTLLIWLFTDKVGLNYLISKIIAAAIVYQWNFFARKIFLYNKK